MLRPFDNKLLEMRRTRRDKPAFTLIELLIIIAMIAIMAGIAVPNFLHAQMRAKNAATVDEIHTLAAALEAYWIEHRAFPPNLVKMVVVPAPAVDHPDVVASRRIELTPAQWLCETSQSATLRMVPPIGDLAKECPLPYNGVVLIRLTTPIAYYGGLLPVDRFFTQGWGLRCLYRPPAVWGATDSKAPAWDLAQMRPYGYYNLAESEPEGIPIAAFGRTVTYVLVSFGPDVRPSFTDPNVWFPASYDPTNGTASYGDLVLPESQ